MKFVCILGTAVLIGVTTASGCTKFGTPKSDGSVDREPAGDGGATDIDAGAEHSDAGAEQVQVIDTSIDAPEEESDACGDRCPSSNGQPCNDAAACASGACTPFHVDGDGDGYGSGTTARLCGTSPPAGYAVEGGDCCDTLSAIHPGAAFQTTIGRCNGVSTWDYDCNGTTEYQHPAPYPNMPAGCLDGCPTCSTQFMTITQVVQCGLDLALLECSSAPCDAMCGYNTIVYFTQGCR